MLTHANVRLASRDLLAPSWRPSGDPDAGKYGPKAAKLALLHGAANNNVNRRADSTDAALVDKFPKSRLSDAESAYPCSMSNPQQTMPEATGATILQVAQRPYFHVTRPGLPYSNKPDLVIGTELQVGHSLGSVLT